MWFLFKDYAKHCSRFREKNLKMSGIMKSAESYCSAALSLYREAWWYVSLLGNPLKIIFTTKMFYK